MKKRILLLDGYAAASHVAWIHGLTSFLSEYDWTVVTLPPRHFSWRIRGSALSFVSHYSKELEQSYDLVICTSMVDLAALKGLCPNLSKCPSILYFHENQFVYPSGEYAKSLLEAQMVTLYSAMAAEWLVFNSHFNQESFIDGAEQLFKKLPDFVPQAWRSTIEPKSIVLPVPIKEPVLSRGNRKRTTGSSAIVLVWNHRWEYDKGPDRLLSALRGLTQRKVDFRLHIVGHQFRKQPEVFSQIEEEFSDKLLSFGFLKSQKDYLTVLASSDVVISTAIHEFQGLSVLEAASYGCVPLVPQRLSYPDIYDEHFLYASIIDEPDKEADFLASKIEKLSEMLLTNTPVKAPSVEQYFWSQLGTQYRQFIKRAMGET